MGIADVKRLQGLVGRVYVDPAIVNYIVGIGYVTRHLRLHRPGPGVVRPVRGQPPCEHRVRQRSPSAGAHRRRNHVVPDDVKALVYRVLRHRVILGFEAVADDLPVERVIDAMVGGIRTP